MKKTLLLAVVIIFAVSLTGCGTKSLVENRMENQIESALGGKADVDIDDGEINIEGENGFSIQAGESVDLPTDFPSDVYVPEGEVKSVMKNPMSAGYSVTIETDDNMEDLYKTYQEKLPAEGWTLGMQLNAGEMYMISGTKETSSVSVSISRQDEKTFVVLTVTSEGIN